ncbi:acyltransferase [Chitinophaga pollutisoli]|uniref:Acyltransferase n=1 Tax=Chitinophaga pollutisoli TaxID=3133966 RepID=A0ABZ2YNZ0_9BACT
MKVYFKNLDAIRFIAALLVILHHGQYFKAEQGVSSWSWMDYMLKDTGRMGVNLFFVLSGFLISYLLFKENKEKGHISFKNFYIRRMLRIWPLYLAYGIGMIVLAPWVFAKLGIETGIGLETTVVNLIFLLLFAVNIQLAFFPYNKGIVEITWSVCIEEQFYLVWPLLVAAFRNSLKTLFVVLLSIGFLSKALCLILPHFFPVTSLQLFGINYVLLFDKLELFGTGMFAAWLLFNKDRFPRFFENAFKPGVQWIMLAITALVVFSVAQIPVLSKYYFDHFIHAFLFGYLMLMAVSPNSIMHLEQPIMKSMGKVSYGIYLFHTPVCQLVMILFLKMFGKVPGIFTWELMYPLTCVAVTCGIAYLSYECFEKYFLRIKSRYAVVQTRI